MTRSGFSVLELLMVIAIIGILGSVILFNINDSTKSTYQARAALEFRSMATALQMYQSTYGFYPADVSRDIPSGLGEFLGGNDAANWPNAPWPGSVYDWENWDDPDNPGEKIYQISVRFCPSSGSSIEDCRFPNEDWAVNFDQSSSAYYCIEGACRSHIDQPINHPGYCINC